MSEDSSLPPDLSAGISAFDFENLPPTALRVVRQLLRHPDMLLASLLEVLRRGFPDTPFSVEDMQDLINHLVAQDVLIQNDQGGYRVNLRRKLSGSAPELWNSVDEPPPPRRRTGLLDSLDLENLPDRRTRPLFDPPPERET
jgi:hypothetical protein